MEENEKKIKYYIERCKLNENEYQGYLESVLNRFTKGVTRNEKPIAIYVAGQTGAGKSNLIKLVNHRFIENGNNAVLCDFDIIKLMHPKYSYICNIPEIVHDVLMPDTGRVVEDLKKYCCKERFNIINHGTMKNVSCTIETLEFFKQNGYLIELDLLSVPRLESYGSILLRYAEAIQAGDLPRIVPWEVHKESYNGLLVTLDELTKRKLYDSVNVYRRGTYNEKFVPFKIYSSNEKQFNSAHEAVEFGRQQYRQEAVNNFSQMFNKVESIFKTMEPERATLLEDWKLLYEEEKRLLFKYF